MEANLQSLLEKERNLVSLLRAAEWELQACDHSQNGRTCNCFSTMQRLRDQLSTIRSQIEAEQRRIQGKVKLKLNDHSLCGHYFFEPGV